MCAKVQAGSWQIVTVHFEDEDEERRGEERAVYISTLGARGRQHKCKDLWSDRGKLKGN